MDQTSWNGILCATFILLCPGSVSLVLTARTSGLGTLLRTTSTPTSTPTASTARRLGDDDAASISLHPHLGSRRQTRTAKRAGGEGDAGGRAACVAAFEKWWCDGEAHTDHLLVRAAPTQVKDVTSTDVAKRAGASSAPASASLSMAKHPFTAAKRTAHKTLAALTTDMRHDDGCTSRLDGGKSCDTRRFLHLLFPAPHLHSQAGADSLAHLHTAARGQDDEERAELDGLAYAPPTVAPPAEANGHGQVAEQIEVERGGDVEVEAERAVEWDRITGAGYDAVLGPGQHLFSAFCSLLPLPSSPSLLLPSSHFLFPLSTSPWLPSPPPVELSASTCSAACDAYLPAVAGLDDDDSKSNRIAACHAANSGRRAHEAQRSARSHSSHLVDIRRATAFPLRLPPWPLAISVEAVGRRSPTRLEALPRIPALCDTASLSATQSQPAPRDTIPPLGVAIPPLSVANPVDVRRRRDAKRRAGEAARAESGLSWDGGGGLPSYISPQAQVPTAMAAVSVPGLCLHLLPACSQTLWRPGAPARPSARTSSGGRISRSPRRAACTRLHRVLTGDRKACVELERAVVVVLEFGERDVCLSSVLTRPNRRNPNQARVKLIHEARNHDWSSLASLPPPPAHYLHVPPLHFPHPTRLPRFS
ncbi:hypothetical protein C8R45DRAFT_1223835 [Mycena sanguinolenta]|nr:hypothetical protein C8R45DRAFT_1223835 [Mycena sanguinolenta]